ncbi:hypothetical protein HY947_04140 [Candidatus Gottesmanbacteria bacterium]|nr:hypothetical protein [Candidatus Gottesmanbacteria bacterium]
MVFSAFGNDAAAFYTAPYLEQTAKQLIVGVKGANNSHVQWVLDFHRVDSDIFYRIIENSTQEKQQKEVLFLCKKLLLIDPSNLKNHRLCLNLVVSVGMPDEVKLALKMIASEFLSNDLYKKVVGINVPKSALPSQKDLDTIIYVDSDEPALYVAKLYYLMGTKTLYGNLQITKQLWNIAKGAYPKMGLVYHELASLELYKFKNMKEALGIISECMVNNHAKLHCKQLKYDLGNVPHPGYVSKDIMIYRE